MPATSQSQQHFMGMVHAYKQGTLNLASLPAGVAEKIKAAAHSMTDKAAKDFAATSHKDLPKKVNEAQSFAQFLSTSGAFKWMN